MDHESGVEYTPERHRGNFLPMYKVGPPKDRELQSGIGVFAPLIATVIMISSEKGWKK